MAENAPYRIRNVVPAKTTKSTICSPIDFQNTSPYPSDWNQRRSTQYDNPIRPQRKTPKAKAIKDKILRRPHVEVRCCGESMKSGNFPRTRSSLDKHSDCRLSAATRDSVQDVPSRTAVTVRQMACHAQHWDAPSMMKRGFAIKTTTGYPPLARLY